MMLIPIVLFKILVFIFTLSVIIVVHEFGHFIIAKRLGVRVEKFSLGFGWRLFRKKKGDTEYSVSAIPLGGYVKLAGDNLEEYKGQKDEFYSQKPGRRFQIIFCGPLLNYIMGFLCFWLIFCVGYPRLTAGVGSLMDGYGAKEAGVLVGDKIIAIDAEKVLFWDELQKIIQTKKPDSHVRLGVLRGNKEIMLDVKIKSKTLDDALGQKRNVGLLGIGPQDDFIEVRHGPVQAFFLGLDKTWELTVLTYKGLWFLLTAKLSLRDSVTGPLGVFYISYKAASLGVIAVLHFFALLNISLAIFNLLPLPVLDGGHIFLLGVEKIRGKLLSIKTERIITQIGFTLILGLAIFVTYNDFVRFFGDKIIKLIK